jgi:hypothetical protein
MPFPTGAANPRHQQKARRVPNHHTRSITQSLMEAAKRKGNRIPNANGKRSRGGIVAYLASLPDELFCQLLGKVVPRTVDATVDAAVTTSVVDRRERAHQLDQDYLQLREQIEALPPDAIVPPELEARAQMLLLERQSVVTP